MSRLCYGLVFVLLSCGGQQSGASECQCKCPPRENTIVCVDLQQLNILIRNISVERYTSHNSRILLAQNLFDEIRKDIQLHGCVVTRILDFYRSLFKHILGSGAKHDRLTNLLKSIKRCIRHKKKVCDELQSASAYVNQTFNQTSLSDLSARKLSLLQINRLDNATQELNDTAVRSKALSELENLESYIQGRSFRRWEHKRHESHDTI